MDGIISLNFFYSVENSGLVMLLGNLKFRDLNLDQSYGVASCKSIVCNARAGTYSFKQTSSLITIRCIPPTKIRIFALYSAMLRSDHLSPWPLTIFQ